MKRLLNLLLLGAALLVPAFCLNRINPFAGRWDMTITTSAATYPGWMEVVEQDGTPQVRVQPRAGGVRPVTGVKMEGAKLILTLEAASANHAGSRWELSAAGDRLSGELIRGDKTAGQVAGVRAPAMRRPAPKAWSEPEAIFNGRDLTGWEPDDAAHNHWAAKDGVLVNQDSGANLKSTRKFEDFQLHIEFDCPQGGNSGVYLRGRYEVQVEYESVIEDTLHEMGSIYGYLAPMVRMPRKPGTWESFDATLVGRRLTLIRNGVKIIDNQEIPGITGGALDSHEGEPGPFYLQGDHYGVMQYRNITIRVPKR